MDELEISGKRYISSRRAAKEHKYHSDYIGQLIRSKKVIGQKVGRSWYVEADSLDAYLRGETGVPAQLTPAPTPEQKNVVENTAEEIETPDVQTPIAEKELEEVVEVKVPESVLVEVIPTQPVAAIREQEMHEYSVPLQIVKTKEEGKTRGLTYMPDTSSLLPDLQKETMHDEPMRAAPVSLDTGAAVNRSPQKGGLLRSTVGLAAVGLLVFSLVSAGAYLFNYTAIVEGDTYTATVTIGYR